MWGDRLRVFVFLEGEPSSGGGAALICSLWWGVMLPGWLPAKCPGDARGPGWHPGSGVQGQAVTADFGPTCPGSGQHSAVLLGQRQVSREPKSGDKAASAFAPRGFAARADRGARHERRAAPSCIWHQGL